jgi:DnaJ-class molecular chaperone
MVQQIQSMCGDCGGTGDFIREKDRCKKCKGKRVIEIDEKLEVIVSPGMSHNQKIPFRGKADEIVSIHYFPVFWVRCHKASCVGVPLPCKLFTDSYISHVIIM